MPPKARVRSGPIVEELALKPACADSPAVNHKQTKASTWPLLRQLREGDFTGLGENVKAVGFIESPEMPPKTSTFPLGRSVAVGSSRPSVIRPVVLKEPVAESYSSALAPSPPAIRTLPLPR